MSSRKLALVIALTTCSLVRTAAAAEPTNKPEARTDPYFRVDPVADTTLVALGLGFAGMNDLILSTGEIQPQRPGDPSKLFALDRGIVSRRFDSGASKRSTIGLYVAVGFAALDPFLSWHRSGGEAAVSDAVLYAESLSLAWAFTGLTKIAVRRPRPNAYRRQAELDAKYGADKSPAITDTDSSLSFFSGHAALVASVSATATYLAFTRSPHSSRPWITLAVGTLLTAGVSIERVRAGAHFPTDVIAGSLAGGGIGLLVPHLHRIHPAVSDGTLSVGIGAAGTPDGVTVSGMF